MAEQEKKDFRVFEYNGKKYKVIRPSLNTLNEAEKLKSKTFNESFQSGDLLRDQLSSELRKRNLWNDELEMEYSTLQQEVIDLSIKLKKGGIPLSHARAIAIDIGHKRSRMIEMLSSRTELDSVTCEGKAEAAKFNYLFANCLVYEKDDSLYFERGLLDYLINQNDPVALRGAQEFYYLISNSEDPTSELIENKFLKEYGFVDDKYRLIDKDGKLIDEKGRHIDEQGNYIEWLEDGTSRRVDKLGRPIDDDGDFDLEFQPFLDDDGNPVEVETKKKTGRKRKRQNTVKSDSTEE